MVTVNWLFVVFLVALFTSCVQTTHQATPIDMDLDRSIYLTQAWCKEVKESFNTASVSANGDFKGVFGAAEISYSSQQKKLSVYGLVNYNAGLMVKYPAFFNDLKRVGQRELYTLGEGYFYLNKEPFNAENPQLTLRKDFTDGTISAEQFVIEVDWMMGWSTYWRKQRYLKVGEETEEQLAKEAPDIEAWARKNRPRPW